MARSPSIVILTGAGISAESGLHTFRDKNGIWNRVRLEDVATPEAFAAHPARVQKFYNKRRAMLPSVQPNAAHHALARLEKTYDGLVTIITQNVDDLHERAGSDSVIHMHGELNKSLCAACGTSIPHKGDLSIDSECGHCGAIGRLRPDVVWFGEMPYQMDRIYELLRDCDLFISIGTSGNVYPAAQFVQEASHGGAHTLEINLEPSLGVSDFAETRHGKAGALLPLFVDEVLTGQYRF
ncbi:NAD-dependent deacylase [Notoacmeibacter sp. MSK16QG-6]|uniref:NAD-dependent deacylase n=1 Tax=Notoacmeibacter sp. MSK16QG-6 TaxID=2957982 RepID=UPI00209CFB18|nr:NAD-dependent deacylase [Notoacmeibacter sp. MSK16QG-6]MCP1198229.1 NAD-dependent deacylase [Notoacmeibacter sp. MSK16QG-6]